VSTPVARFLVVAFLLLDVALGVLVWRHLQGEPSGAASPRATSAPTDNPDVFIPTGGTGSENFQAQQLSAGTLFDASSDVVIVATTGDCRGTAPTVRVSEDGGQNFAPVKPDVSRVLAVSVRPDGSLAIVGADDDCDAVGLTSDDGGSTWDEGPVGSGWYRDPQSTTGLVVAGSASDVGCPIMTVSDVSDSAARVSCEDGTVRATDDGGDSWTSLGGLTAVRALGFSSGMRGVALVQTDDCSASAFLTVNGGTTWEQRGCADGQMAHAVLDQGDRLLAAVDATVAASDDGGLTWEPPTGG